MKIQSTNSLEYAKVALLKRLPINLHFFDYKIPEDLKNKIQIGQIVEAPFRKKNLLGVVVGLESKTDFRGKILEIKQLVSTGPIFTENQIDLAKFISQEYLVSLSLVFKNFLPYYNRKFLSQKNLEGQSNIFSFSVKDKSKDYPLGKLLHYCNIRDFQEVLREEIIGVLQNQKQILFLIPEIAHQESFLNFLKAINLGLSVNIVAWHSQAPKKQFLDNWLKIKSGEPVIVLGTRSAIFAPFQNLGLIIVFDEEKESYKQTEPNPRYNAKKLVLFLAEKFQAQVIFISQAFSIETFYLAKQNNWPIIETGKSLKKIKYEIVTKKPQFNNSIIEEKTQELLLQFFSSNKKILVYFNQIGYAKNLICRDCFYFFRCENCLAAYLFFSKKENLFCPSCHREIAFPLVCPNCHGHNLVFLKSGIEKLEKEIGQIIGPQKILRIDSQTIKKENLKELLRKINEYPLILATNQFFSLPKDDFSFDLAFVLGLDELLVFQGEFRNQERVFQLLSYLTNFASQIIIESSLGQDWASYKFENPDDFYTKELKERKKWGFPPFSKLIKIIVQEKSVNQLKAKTKKIQKRLSKIAKDFELSSFYPLRPFYRNGLYRQALIMKCDPNKSINDLNLEQVLPNDVLIDTDPLNIF